MSSSNESNGTDGFDISCFDVYSDPRYTALAVMNIVFSIASILCLLVAISIIVLFKKYMYFSQKLILYLCIASLFYAVSNCLNVTPSDVATNTASRGYCIVMGFLDQTIYWWMIMSMAIIMIDVFIRVAFETDTQKYKIPYIIGILVPPLVISWIPFLYLSYGPAGVFCWIRNRNYEDCSTFSIGNYFRFSVYYIPFYILMFILAVLLALSLCIARRKRKQWITGNLGKETKELQKKIASEIRPLIGYPVLFMIISIIPLISRIYDATNPPEDDVFYYILFVLLVAVYRLIGVTVSLIFVLDKETRKHLNKKEIRAAYMRWRGLEKGYIGSFKFKIGQSDSFIDKNTAMTGKNEQ